MILQKNVTNFTNKETGYMSLLPSGTDLERLMFFDIETTGLSANTSCLYLIGCLHICGDEWVLEQFFAEDLSEEGLLLESFHALIREDTLLVHYNGDHFDIPYLDRKCEQLGTGFSFGCCESADLYKLLRPYKKALGLGSMKQKALEEFLNIRREDKYDGGELIDVYKDFLVQKKLRRPDAANERLSLLLLHNYCDVLGMMEIMPLLSLSALLSKKYHIEEFKEEGEKLVARLSLDYSYPGELSIASLDPSCSQSTKDHEATDSCPVGALSVRSDSVTLSVGICEAELKLFFDNPKEYYYLPSEDRAIHRSLGEFIDKSLRRAATKANCYERFTGRFLPGPEKLYAQELKKCSNDKLSFYPVDHVVSDEEEANRYSFIDFWLHKYFFML